MTNWSFVSKLKFFILYRIFFIFSTFYTLKAINIFELNIQ